MPSNISNNDDIEDLKSNLILKMLKYQLLIQKEWIIQPPKIIFYLKLKAKLFILIQIQNHGMKLLFNEEQDNVVERIKHGLT